MNWSHPPTHAFLRRAIAPVRFTGAGVRVFSLSNNHTYDKGASGIAATLRFWGSMPEDVVTIGLWKGESDYGHVPLQTVNGVTIAYLSYTEHTNGIPQNSSMQANVIYTSGPM